MRPEEKTGAHGGYTTYGLLHCSIKSGQSSSQVIKSGQADRSGCFTKPSSILSIWMARAAPFAWCTPAEELEKIG